MTRAFYSHFLTMSLLHGVLFFGAWKTVTSDEMKRFVPKFGNGVIQMKVSSGLFMPTKRPVQQQVEVIKKKVSKMALPTPKVIEPTTPVVPQSNDSGSSVGSADGTGGNPNGYAFGTGSGSGKFTAMDLYKAELRAKIDKNKYYPTMSRRLGQTGTVVIAFTLLEDGNIVNIRIDKPSQYERLNVSALDAVKKVERFKPIPKEVGENKMDIKVPVKFVTI